MELDFHVKQVDWQQYHNQLSAIRSTVFIEEQKVPPELEWDEYDSQCTHVLATTADGNAIGTARLLANGHIGRMAVLAEYRGKYVGGRLLTELLNIAKSQQLESVFLHAQTSAVGFYEKFGFKAYGDEFMDAGIPHLSMKLDL